MTYISDRISILEAQNEPLSADVGIIRGDENTWFFDVGSCDEAFELISNTIGAKKCVISHFHPDHMGNLKRLNFDEAFVGKNTYRYSNMGTIVEGDLIIDDGCKLHIFPVPSSHAKGSLGLEIDDSLIFLGDAVYPTRKGGKAVYNAQLVYEFVVLLKKLKANDLFISHQKQLKNREALIAEFEKIYAKRSGNEPYILV